MNVATMMYHFLNSLTDNFLDSYRVARAVVEIKEVETVGLRKLEKI